MSASLLVLLSLQAAAPDPTNCAIEATVATALPRERYRYCIGLAREGRAVGYRLHYQYRRDGTGDEQSFRVTSATCPDLSAHIAALEQLPMPSIDVPGVGPEQTSFTLDGASHTLRSYVRWADEQSGELRLSSNLGTPLAAWMQELRGIVLACAPTPEPR